MCGVSLPAGRPTLKLVMDSAGTNGAIANFNSFNVTRDAGGGGGADDPVDRRDHRRIG
jgi:hypothetical protein